jgi:hypothetical protein
VINEEVYTELMKKGHSYIQEKEGRMNGLVAPCVGTALLNMLLKEKATTG